LLAFLLKCDSYGLCAPLRYFRKLGDASQPVGPDPSGILHKPLISGPITRLDGGFEWESGGFESEGLYPKEPAKVKMTIASLGQVMAFCLTNICFVDRSYALYILVQGE
jgi:hypothetical protein